MVHGYVLQVSIIVFVSPRGLTFYRNLRHPRASGDFVLHSLSSRLAITDTDELDNTVEPFDTRNGQWIR
jgi:hypothetical protein